MYREHIEMYLTSSADLFSESAKTKIVHRIGRYLARKQTVIAERVCEAWLVKISLLRPTPPPKTVYLKAKPNVIPRIVSMQLGRHTSCEN